MATVGVAALSCFFRPARRLIKKLTKKADAPCWVHQDVVFDFLNGTIIVPLAVMVGGCFSHELLEEVVKTEKVFMATAAIVSLLLVLKEFGKD